MEIEVQLGEMRGFLFCKDSKMQKVQCPIDKDIFFELPDGVEKDCKCETLENNKTCKMNMFGCYGCLGGKEMIKLDFKRFNQIAKKFLK